jgi:hypothetical protein
MVAVAPVVSRSTKANGRMLAVVILGWAMIVVSAAICGNQRVIRYGEIPTMAAARASGLSLGKILHFGKARRMSAEGVPGTHRSGVV